jgi:hypothetical protein
MQNGRTQPREYEIWQSSTLGRQKEHALLEHNKIDALLYP